MSHLMPDGSVTAEWTEAQGSDIWIANTWTDVLACVVV